MTIPADDQDTPVPTAGLVLIEGGASMVGLRTLATTYVQGRYRRGEIEGPARRAIDQSLRTLVESFGDRPLNQLGRAAIDRWMSTILRHAPSTQRNHLSRVRRFCRWLVDEGHLRRDPTRHVQPIHQPRRVPLTLTTRQVDTLRAHVAGDLRASVIVALMWDACCRCCEVSRLRLEDYDPIGQTVFLRGKGGHERTVSIDASTATIIDAYLTETGIIGGPLLRNRDQPSQGLAATTLSHYVRHWMIDAGVKVRAFDGRSAHGLRRTGASELMEACDNVVLVQAHLGHVKPETTVRHYLRPVSQDKMRAAVAKRHAGQADLPDVA